MEHIKVGETAKKIGINVETLRYYEKIKLMPKPKRTDSRYRYYDQNDLKRLLFIKRAKELGFTLKEIKELLEIKVGSSSTCDDVKRLSEHKLEDVNKKIEDLTRIQTVLEKLINQCVREEISTDVCPILETIEINKEEWK